MVFQVRTQTRVQVQTDADPIMMFCGQFVHAVQDFKIDGAGIDFVFKRVYGNHAFYNGPLGYKWNHNYNLWLRVTLRRCRNHNFSHHRRLS